MAKIEIAAEPLVDAEEADAPVKSKVHTIYDIRDRAAELVRRARKDLDKPGKD